MLTNGVLARQCMLRPNHPALTFEGNTVTYQELNDRSAQLAHALAGLGISKGERVAVLAKNCSQYLEVYFGNGKLGSVTVPLNYRLTVAELEYIIDNSEAVCLMATMEYVGTINSLKERLPHIKHFICIDGKAEGYLEYASFIDEQPTTDPDVDIDEEDLIWQMYTSGTTGRPKGAMITHRNLTTNIMQVGLQLRVTPDDRGLIVAPMYHAAAMINIMGQFAEGATAVIKSDFIPDQVIGAFRDEGITIALLVPAMILFLLRMPETATLKFESLKYIVYGASVTPGEVLRQAIKVFGCNFAQGFGQTESTAVLTVLSAEDHMPDGTPEQQALLQSCGRPVFGTEVRIVDEEGNEVPNGEKGEIIARGDQVMKGYWKMPEATESTLQGGWLHTGDIGIRDDQGFIFIVDRLKDMIVSGGENVYPREIEEVLFTHPHIADAAVIGIPSDTWGEEVKAMVVLKPDADCSEKDIMSFCGEHLAGYKRPRSVDFLEVLPKNPSGKVLKKELREPYWKDVDRRVN